MRYLNHVHTPPTAAFRSDALFSILPLLNPLQTLPNPLQTLPPPYRPSHTPQENVHGSLRHAAESQRCEPALLMGAQGLQCDGSTGRPGTSPLPPTRVLSSLVSSLIVVGTTRALYRPAHIGFPAAFREPSGERTKVPSSSDPGANARQIDPEKRAAILKCQLRLIYNKACHWSARSIRQQVGTVPRVRGVKPSSDLEEVRILDSEQDYFKRGIKEAIYIRALQPSLNRDGGDIDFRQPLTLC
ncbi:hypothetical protein Bbelb_153530 [Branchiostoma belcheri]|nr:hypothetical protein Bbelb_153530 [Branchiostoma belcheri]